MIDLHSHTTVSDGTDDPREVVLLANTLDVLAITDHDTAPGWDEAATAGWARAVAALAAVAAAGGRLTLVPGAELSCRWDDRGTTRSAHLLAYLFRPDDPELRDAVAAVRATRSDRIGTMVERLQERGVAVTVADVGREARRGWVGSGEPTLGRPHLAAALRAARPDLGPETVWSDDWLGAGGGIYERKGSIDLVEAVGMVRRAGGVAVLAHPARGTYAVPETVVRAAADAGLDGIEVDHPWLTDVGVRQQLRGLATSLGLLITGGSDYHGTRKPESLGDGLTSEAAYEVLVGLAADRGGVAPVG